MTKTDFAELKEKLCYFDSQKNYNEILTETLIKNATRDSKDLFVVMYSGARNAGRNEQNTKSAAIISELMEIIKSQSEKLNELNEFTSSVLEDMEHYFDNKCVPTLDEVNQCAVADSLLRVCIGQTTTRLQKLREGIR